MSNVPNIKDMPWLKEETQEDVNKMYCIYERENKLMIPLEDVEAGKVYTLIYVPDSGCPGWLLDIFREAVGEFKYRDVLQMEVEVVRCSWGGHDMRIKRESYLDDGRILGFSCLTMNYGKSWRLLP